MTESPTFRMIAKIESVHSENTWRMMSFEQLQKRFVAPLIALSENDITEVVQSLTPHAYDMLRKKLWTAQDIPASDNGYARTTDIMIALKRCLLFRLPMIESGAERASITQQLSLVSLILNPRLLEGAIGQQEADEEEEDSDEFENESGSDDE